MRELMDNQRQAAPPEQWHLKLFLDEIVGQLDKVDGLAALPFHKKFACVYQILSAIEYFAVSGPALSRMYGAKEFGGINDAYSEELRAQVRRLIAFGAG